MFDFSRDGIMRSLEESLERLGIDRIDVVLVHDPDDHEGDALRARVPDLARGYATKASWRRSAAG